MSLNSRWIPGSRALWSGVLAAVVVVAVAIAWLHPQIVFSGKVYASTDAQAAAAFQSLGDGSHGEFPHWNPFVFCGMPSYASLAYNPGAYPLTTPVRMVRDALGLPPMFWLLFHLGLAALTTVGWVRWRGESWVAAIAAGCWVIALPKLAAWGAYGHGTKLGSFAWLPLVGWCTEALLRRGGLAWASGLALGMGMMLLRGHVQIAWYAVFLVGILVLAAWIADARDAQARRRLLRATGLIAAAGMVALCLSLVLYLPVLEYQAHSIRGAGGGGGAPGAAFDYATSWSLSWPEFSTMWWPTAAGYGRGAYVGQMPFTDYPNYIGLPILLLACAGCFVRRDRMTWALLALIVVTTLLALGRNFFVYRVFFELAPGFSKFRVPVMVLALQELALILLAARGLGALCAREARLEIPKPLLILVGAGGLLAVAMGTVGASAVRDTTLEALGSMARQFGRPVPPAALLTQAADLAVGDALRLGLVVLLGAGALVAASMRRMPRVAVMVLIGALVFIDLARVDQPLLHPEGRLSRAGRSAGRVVIVPSESLIADAGSLADYTTDSALVQWLKQQSPRPRVLPLGGLEADNRLAAQHVVSLGGYHAAKLRLYEDIRSRIFDPAAPQFRLARLFAAQWVVTPMPLRAQTLSAIATLGLPLVEEPVWTGADGTVYAVSDPLPRAWVVDNVSLEVPGQDRTAGDPEASVLTRIVAGDFDPRHQAILSALPDPRPQSGASAATVKVLEEGYNSWSLEVDLPVDGVLVTPDPWYPGWKVDVDGQPATLLRANYAQRAVALTAGAHRVQFHYDAQAWVTGRRIAGVGWILILAGWTVPLLRRRRAAKPVEQA